MTTDRDGFDSDVPDYNADPAEAALAHWEYHKSLFPPEFVSNPDYKNRVWIETINEVDKNRSEWLAEFALETAQLANADGYKWAAFAWSSGEPEVSHWQGEEMVKFLTYASQRPNQVAIALHEYSYTTDNVQNIYPYLMGRFQALFRVADSFCIQRPTVLITEWGWGYQDVPDVETAMDDIEWAAQMYAAYPEVKGAMIWYLGSGFGGIANDAQKFISPVQDFSLTTYYGVHEAGVVDPTLFGPVADPWLGGQAVDQLRQSKADIVDRESATAEVRP